MRKASILKLQKVIYGLFLVILTACGQVSPATPTLTATRTVPPTSTVTPIPTITDTPEPTPTPQVKQFQECDIENWKECSIAPKDLLAYADWVKERLVKQGLTLPAPDPSKGLVFFGDKFLSFHYAGPQFKEIPFADRPFLVGNRFGVAEFDVLYPLADNQMLHFPYVVTTVAFSVPDKPGELVVVPVVMHGQFYNESDEEFSARLHALLDNGFFRLEASSSKIIITQVEEMNTSNVPDMADRIKKFYETLDPTHIEGLIFKIEP